MKVVHVLVDQTDLGAVVLGGCVRLREHSGERRDEDAKEEGTATDRDEVAPSLDVTDGGHDADREGEHLTHCDEEGPLPAVELRAIDHTVGLHPGDP